MSVATASGPLSDAGAAVVTDVPGAITASARSMRVVYGQRRVRTLSKLVVLSFFYLVSGSLMLALVSVYSVFTL